MDGDEGGSPPEAPRGKAGGLKGYLAAALAGAAILGIGVAIGRSGGGQGPKPPGEAGTEPSAQAAAESPKAGGGLLDKIFKPAPPCVLVAVKNIRDEAPQSYMAALREKAPDWQISSTIEPGECEPNLYVQVVSLDVEITRHGWNTVNTTSGVASAIAIAAPSISQLQLATQVGEDRDQQIESFADNTVEVVKGGLGKPGASLPAVRDGVTCLRLTNERNEFDEDGQARNMIGQMRYWKIAGQKKEDRCQPDVLMSRSSLPIKGGGSTEGWMVAYAMLTGTMPTLTVAWAGDSYRAELMSLRSIFEGVPPQIDPDAPDQKSEP